MDSDIKKFRLFLQICLIFILLGLNISFIVLFIQLF